MTKRIRYSLFYGIIGGAAICLIIIAVALYFSPPKKDNYPVLYLAEVQTAAQKYNLSPELILAVIRTESNFAASAKSSSGALGLMQLMPKTFEELQGRRKESGKYTADDLFIPSLNVDYGCYYLRYLLDYFDGELTHAVAAYNAGMGNVKKWLSDARYAADGRLIADNIPFTETRAYVERVMSARDKYKEKLGE